MLYIDWEKTGVWVSAWKERGLIKQISSRWKQMHSISIDMHSIICHAKFSAACLNCLMSTLDLKLRTTCRILIWWMPRTHARKKIHLSPIPCFHTVYNPFPESAGNISQDQCLLKQFFASHKMFLLRMFVIWLTSATRMLNQTWQRLLYSVYCKKN